MAFASIHLRWRPADFWAATPREFWAAALAFSRLQREMAEAAKK